MAEPSGESDYLLWPLGHVKMSLVFPEAWPQGRPVCRYGQRLLLPAHLAGAAFGWSPPRIFRNV